MDSETVRGLGTLARLPPEIRQQVYRDILCNGTFIDLVVGEAAITVKANGASPQLLYTSKILHHEAYSMFYSENVFRITVDMRARTLSIPLPAPYVFMQSTIQNIATLLKTIGSPNSSRIQHIEIEIMGESETDTLEAISGFMIGVIAAYLSNSMSVPMHIISKHVARMKIGVVSIHMLHTPPLISNGDPFDALVRLLQLVWKIGRTVRPMPKSQAATLVGAGLCQFLSPGQSRRTAVALILELFCFPRLSRFCASYIPGPPNSTYKPAVEREVNEIFRDTGWLERTIRLVLQENPLKITRSSHLARLESVHSTRSGVPSVSKYTESHITCIVDWTDPGNTE